jgi:lipopolysaccharide export system permease protein
VKRLHRLITVSFLGPFVLTFFIVLFLLLMQFLWRYIDDLVGKGLDFKVIAELMAYASASLVPMALPLAVLLSSLMTFGNMGEFYELTAMKASGISLQRIMFPLVILVFFLSIGAFFFANDIMPYTNLKMKSLLYDVRQQRPELQIKEGEFYNGIENYSIRINRKDPETNMLFDIKIYDHSMRKGNMSLTIADSGKMEMTADKRNLLVTLWHGKSYTELEEDRKKRYNTYPQRIDIFDERKTLITLTGFGLQRTDENLFKNYYQMLNISQLSHAKDSLNAEMEMRNRQFQHSLVVYHYFKIRQTPVRSIHIPPFQNALDTNTSDSLHKPLKVNFDSLFSSFGPSLRQRIVSSALANARSAMSFIENTDANLKYERRNIRRHEIEWHRKFTLAAACLIFLFIGAPLGAIIRKGGLGMPAVISTVLFILYYIISLTGEKIVRESVVSSLQGMWLSSFILVVVGVFLTYKATNDSSMLNLDSYVAFVRTYLGIDKGNMLDKKIYLSGKFNIIDVSRDSLRSSLLSLTNKAVECKKSIRSGARIRSLYKKLLHAKPDESLVELIRSYNQFFDQIVMSKWFTIKYIRDRLQEFPVLGVPEKYKLPSRPVYRLLIIVIFPLFLGYLLVYHISIRRTVSKLDFIAEKSKFLSESLENPSLLIDFDN